VGQKVEMGYGLGKSKKKEKEKWQAAGWQRLRPKSSCAEEKKKEIVL
jgi:hypothetical protein